MKNIKTIFSKIKSLEAYIKINLLFAGIIIAIIIYSGIFSAQNEHPIKCVHFEQTGIPCETCGISRSFSEIVRFDFQSAKDFNRNGIPIFLFFLIQLVFRILFSLIYSKNWTKPRNVIIIDSLVSILLFLIMFKNLIF
jgi:hypothetical protein